MKINCIECGSYTSNTKPRWFIVPSHIFVPNQYYLCEVHKDNKISFEDIYNQDGTRKIRNKK